MTLQSAYLPEGFVAALHEAAGTPVALATVTAVTGSSPVPVGEQMLVTGDGRAFGSVSNGCIDADVYHLALAVLADGAPQTRCYGPDGSVLDATVTCGGTLEVAVERIVTADAEAAVAAVRARAGGPVGERLFLVGGTTVAARLSRIAGTIGLRSVVVDPRPVFAAADRFPGADEVVCGWPVDVLRAAHLSSSDAVVVLVHDDRFDVDVVRLAVETGAGYVGALGSLATAARRRAELLESGMAAADVAAVRSPVGAAIGAVGPAEIAISIAADLVAHRRQG